MQINTYKKLSKSLHCAQGWYRWQCDGDTAADTQKLNLVQQNPNFPLSNYPRLGKQQLYGGEGKNKGQVN